MTDSGIRWIQRFHNFQIALAQLNDAVLLSKERELSLLEKQGLIQAFEYTHELAWKVMKDFFEYQGSTIHGSRDATREAFQNRLIEDGEVWMNMIIARNLTSHAYDQINAEQALAEIQNSCHGQFLQFQQTMVKLVEST